MTESKKRAPIITLATLKGGSGKSTTAACLACHTHKANMRVVLVDADPQGSLMHWHGLGEPPLDIRVIGDISENVGRNAQALAADYDLVVIDTAGFRNRTMIDALAVADLAVVPIKASPLDIAAALETVTLIGEIAASPDRAGRALPYRMLLTQVTVGSVVARHVREQLLAQGQSLLQSELANRVGYAEAALEGRMPLHLEPNGAAARDGAALVAEVWIHLTRGERDHEEA